MNLRFDHPWFLLIALLGVVMALLSLPRLGGLDGLRRTTAVLLRIALVGLLAFALAGPRRVREHDALAVIGLLDVSASVRRFAQIPESAAMDDPDTLLYLRDWFRTATQERADDDRFGLITFDGRATVISAPMRGRYVDDPLDVRTLEGTNIAEALHLGLAMFPADSARRLVLVTDGNETAGDAIDAARRAAATVGAGVPIDVLPLAYAVPGDVQVVRVESPPIARPDQAVTVRIVLEATAPTTGTLRLMRERDPVDLNGADPGFGRRVTVPAGRSVQLAEVMLGETPVNRFEALFAPDDPSVDALPDNNRATSLTATPGRGAVLIVRRGERGPGQLAATLEAAGLPVSVRDPAAIPTELLSLQAYDLIVLDDIGAYDLETYQHRLLTDYVHRLGGGLLVTGGRRSFGAGGWKETMLEEVLPLQLDIPDELRLPDAALVLVLDKSGSMAQSVPGARATQQEIANEGAALAIESLRPESFVGVVAFDSRPRVRAPLQRNREPERIAKSVRAISPEGGTNIARALRRAKEMLDEHPDIPNRHIVCLTDGQSDRRELEQIAGRIAEANIRLTTIGVGQDADFDLLQDLAAAGGGEFYAVRNPRVLPRVLVDSVQVVNTPLIKEQPFQALARATGSTLTAGVDRAPPLLGLVLTAPRDDPTAVIELVTPDDEPVLARWQAGLGRVAAFTPDADGEWSRRWIAWSGYDRFWTQLARSIARPAMTAGFDLDVAVESGRLRIVLEADPERAAELADAGRLRIDGLVYGPGGRDEPIRLRQVGPLRFEADLDVPDAGNYIVALSPIADGRPLAPIIGGATRPPGEEFRRYTSNIALLREIAETTGGRLLELESPRAVNLYDRAGMPASFSALPVWPLVLWLGLGAMLLDIACRRIAWSRALLVGAFAAAVRRTAPAREKGMAAAATLDTLRQVPRTEPAPATTSSAPSEGSSRAPRGPAPAQGGEAEAPAPEPATETEATAPAPPKPGRADVDRALAALRGERKTPPPKAKPEAAPPPDADASETTGSLLAARRRRHGQPDDDASS